MRRSAVWLRAAGVLVLTLSVLPVHARKRDPLNSPEIDQLRETAQEPDKRLKLYCEFAVARLAAIEQLRAGKDPAAAARPDAKSSAKGAPEEKPEILTDAQRTDRVHDLLEDFVAIYDELEDNIATYDDRKADLRKALRPVIAGDAEMKVKLAALQHNLTPAETEKCEFLMRSAVEAVTSGLEDHQKLLAVHQASWKDRKK